MPLMTWNEKMSVGIDSLDNEHKKLVAMLNDLFDAVQAGKSKDVLGRILDGLIDYTKTHFAHEEQFMGQYNYPQLAAHKQEHADLTAQVIEVQNKYKSGSTSVLGVEVMNFLKNWLLRHIQGTDKKYGPFLKSKGVR